MDDNWVKIIAVSESYRAELIKGMLSQHDIEAVSINKKDSAYLFGEVEIYVPVEFAMKAKRLINEQKEI